MWCLGALRADQDREDEEDSALAAGLSGLRLFHLCHGWSSAVSRPPAAPSRPGVSNSFWFAGHIEDYLFTTLTLTGEIMLR